jgi:GntR family transcriptional regulator
LARLPGVPIDPTSPDPPYRQIADALIGRIRSGTYRANAKLPSREALRREFGVASATAALAVRTIVQEGYAVSRQGLGTFVLDTEPAVPRRTDVVRVVENHRALLRALASDIQSDPTYRPMASIEVVRHIVARIRTLADELPKP